MTRTDRTLTKPGLDSGSATEPPRAGGDRGPIETLNRVRRTETIADCVDFEALRRELPSGWSVRPDLVQFGVEPLAETVSFQRAFLDSKLVLKPVDSANPTGNIEFYEQSDPRASRRQTMTVGPLSDALRVAVNRIHQLDS